MKLSTSLTVCVCLFACACGPIRYDREAEIRSQANAVMMAGYVTSPPGADSSPVLTDLDYTERLYTEYLRLYVAEVYLWKRAEYTLATDDVARYERFRTARQALWLIWLSRPPPDFEG